MSEKKIIKDTIRLKDSITLPKEQLAGILKTKADLQRNDFPNRMTYLVKNAQVIYLDMQIDADYISINRNTNEIFARSEMDSLGRVIKPVVATQGGKKYEITEFKYNFKTKQAIAYNSRTEEGEGVIIAQKTKKYNDSVYFMRRGLYSTDEYFLKKKDSLADYHLQASSIKLIKGKEKTQVVTGPIQLYIEQVPTPLILPFAILPMSEKRSAGILIPSFGERPDVGFFLNGLGYYQPIGQHFDFKTYLDFFTKGSWNLRPEVNYLKKYKYSGNFSAEFGTTIRGIKGLDDFSKQKTFSITWRHSQDQKANPLFNFSASVNVVSSKFYNNTINNNNIFNQNVLNSRQNSSISITKRFLNLPITITGTASYDQNFITGSADFRFPNVNVMANQFYLFKPKTGVRTGLLENITINTGLNVTNFVTTNEGEFFTKTMWEKMNTGLKNNIAIATNTNIAKYFTFSLGANVDNALTTKTIQKAYNPITNTVENTTIRNITGFSVFNTSASLQTVLYKTILFKKNSFIQGIRHMITPSIGFTYRPDFGKPTFGYFSNYYDANGNINQYSIFEGSIIGSPTSGVEGAMTFSLGNNLEMKIKSKKDSTGLKKIKIFETLNFSTSYNFAAQKNRWSVISVNGQTSLFQSKLNLNTNMTIDPYQYIKLPGQTNLTRTDNFGHFSVMNVNVNMAYPLSDIIFGEKKDYGKIYKNKGEIRNENYYFDDDYYARFAQPWTLNLNMTYGYNKLGGTFGSSTASLGISGNIKLTPYWDINGNTNYDFVTKELGFTRLGFSRNQRSFTINFNWVPFGANKVYDFFIGIRANILSDALKYNDRSFTQPNAPF